MHLFEERGPDSGSHWAVFLLKEKHDTSSIYLVSHGEIILSDINEFSSSTHLVLHEFSLCRNMIMTMKSIKRFVVLF